MRKPKIPDGKRRYSVGAAMTISVHTEVIASSPEEAKEIAESRDVMSFCHYCSSQSHESWTASELDGEPSDLEVLEINE